MEDISAKTTAGKVRGIIDADMSPFLFFIPTN